MKRILIISLLTAISRLAFGHEFTASCPENKRSRIVCSGMTTAAVSNFIRVRINTPGLTWANGSRDTVFPVQASFVIFAPQPSMAVSTSLTFDNLRGQNGPVVESVNFDTPTCTSLPVDIGWTKAKWLNERRVELRVFVLTAEGENTLSLNIKSRDGSVTYPPMSLPLDKGKEGTYVFILDYTIDGWKLKSKELLQGSHSF